MAIDARPTRADLTGPLNQDGFFAGDPWPLLATLRAEAPMVWDEEIGSWFASRHADVMAASVDNATFCSGKGILTLEIGIEYPSPPTMMHTDAPEHTRYRKLVQPAFGPKQIRALEPTIRDRTRRLLHALPLGEPVDIVPSLTEPLPLQMIGMLLGVDEADHERFLEWSEAAIPGAVPLTAEEQARRMADMHAYLLGVAQDRRANPRDDVITALATAEVDGDRLTDAELEMFLVQLLVAGNETTRHALSGGLHALANDPEQWATLQADSSAIPAAVEEMLRWTTPVISFMRTATRDAELGGVTVRDGDPVVLLYASANRDESVFGADAASFRIDRSPNPQIAFGFGAHFCLGAALARMEARVLLEELLDLAAKIEPVGDVTRTQSLVIAGITKAELVLTPRS